jgi:ribonucleoside-diphosphate reductase alpha chain
MMCDTTSQVQPPLQPFCHDTLIERYAASPDETTADAIRQRVARIGKDEAQALRFLRVQRRGFVAGGRINRSAGTGLDTTLMNCFVQPVGDTMSGVDHQGRPGIMDAMKQAAETMRRGGGVGYDFSPIRPAGALVRGTDSRASGPVSYMRLFDRMCETVESAGARKGAQMGILRVDHPDIEQFIDAKKTADFRALGLGAGYEAALLAMIGANAEFGWAMRRSFSTLGNFNLAVAVTDDFMRAVIEDRPFDLVHEAAPGNGPTRTRPGPHGRQLHVYRTASAREIWDRIMRNAYTGSEPGVVFIDRVNEDNNLWYCEQIDACNPCGEQFLPAYGCCCLGSLMLQQFVTGSFTENASFDWKAFGKVAARAVEFLDRALDVTRWPLPEQQVEAHSKRRIGLGYLGLADAMSRLGIRYNSADGVAFARLVHAALRDATYLASIDLAKELGPFPLFDADQYLKAGTFASRLPAAIQDGIREHGIRNSHLLSIAPTGTISLAFGDNASSGIEPIFSRRQERVKILSDGSRKTFTIDNAAFRDFKERHGPEADSELFVGALEMSVGDHMAVLEAAAPLVDGAISKTINVPASCEFTDFAGAYMRAWKAGLKGVSTYRPNPMRGHVLRDAAQSVDGLSMNDPDRRVELKTGIQTVTNCAGRVDP